MLIRLLTSVCVVAIAVSLQAGPPVPLGTLTSTFGTAQVSGTSVPSGAAVFSGDTIETRAAKAVFTFTGGDSVMLGPNARVRISQAGNVPAIEVLKGMSRVQLRTKEFKLVASNWTLQPRLDASTGRAIADVLRDSTGAVSVSVQEGELLARNSAGKPFAVAKAGRPTMLPASAVPPAASAPPPQIGSPSSELVWGAYIAAGVAGTLAVIALVGDDDDDGAAAAQALAAQVTDLQSQVSALLAQLNALSGDFEAVAALTAELGALQAELATIQAEINQILAVDVGAAGESVRTSSHANARLAFLQGLVNNIIARLAAITNLILGYIG